VKSLLFLFCFSSRRRHTRSKRDWSSDVCSSDLTRDEVTSNARIQTRIDGQVVQDSSIDDLLFDIPQIISYLSVFTTLQPGDVISTGTPSGVGVAQEPKRFLLPGEVLETTVEGVGSLKNTVINEQVGRLNSEPSRALTALATM